MKKITILIVVALLFPLSLFAQTSIWSDVQVSSITDLPDTNIAIYRTLELDRLKLQSNLDLIPSQKNDFLNTRLKENTILLPMPNGDFESFYIPFYKWHNYTEQYRYSRLP